MRKSLRFALVPTALLAAASSACATGQGGGGLLGVGEMAPDFELAGATRYGALAEPVRLSDYRGETVVLAFFFRVRGGG